MAHLFTRFMDLFTRLSAILPGRPNVSKRSVLLVTSVGGVFTIFFAAIYMRRKRKYLLSKSPDTADQNAVTPAESKQPVKRKKRRSKYSKLDLTAPSSESVEERKYASGRRRDHSMMSEASTVSSVKSNTSRNSRITRHIALGTKEFIEAEKLYRKGVNAFEVAMEQWEKAGIVLNSESDFSSGQSSNMSTQKSSHPNSTSLHDTPKSTLNRPRIAKCRSEYEGQSSASDSVISGNERAVVSEETIHPNTPSKIEDKLLLFVQRAEKLQQSFEEVLYSSESEETESDTDITLTGFDIDSDTESFVSAQEAWEVRSLEDFPTQRLALYEEALETVDAGKVPCRAMRTEMLECFSDSEFLAKLHCVRRAIDLMLEDVTVREWLSENGKLMIECLLKSANRNTTHFAEAYTILTNYVQNPENWVLIEEELKHRKVVCMTFYDVVLDFIIMDSFDDLENPPSQLVSVLSNRWLTNSIKETALNTAVWSVLKAKSKMLRYKDGFVARFYAVSETISPVLAWGFLGTDDKLKSDCEKFKSEVLSFLKGVFSFDQVRYTTVEQMSDDILNLARRRTQNVLDHFQASRA